MLSRLFKKKKPVTKAPIKRTKSAKRVPTPKPKATTSRASIKPSNQKILTAEGWKRLMMRSKNGSKKKI